MTTLNERWSDWTPYRDLGFIRHENSDHNTRQVRLHAESPSKSITIDRHQIARAWKASNGAFYTGSTHFTLSWGSPGEFENLDEAIREAFRKLTLDAQRT